MKLASLYSNFEDIFPRIYFNRGFNVVFALVKDPKRRERDSHNLGKTLLINIIDFGLLGGTDRGHPFKEHPDRFGDFTFYLELETNEGEFVTVKRNVEGRRPICIHVASERNLDLRDIHDNAWKHSNLSVNQGREILNDLLDLKAIDPYTYRKGLGYILRRQNDYEEIFRISKFQYGADKDWKPFLAKILGFDHDLIQRKYALDDKVKELERARDIIEREAGSRREEYDEIRGEIEIKTAALERLRAEVGDFSFREIEAKLSDTVVNEIEAELASLNERRYILDYRIQDISRSLETEFEFDISRIQAIFEEARLVFPENLRRSYEDLVEFNKRLSSGRMERLRDLSQRLTSEREDIQKRIQELDKQRQSVLEILQEQRTLDKYRSLQGLLIEREREIMELHQRLEQLSRASVIQQEVNEVRQEITNTVEAIRNSIHSDNSVYRLIRRTFSAFVEEIVNVQALLYVNVNQQGNLEFNVRTLDRDITDRETSEGRGMSYRKILCACFDLALLSAYASESFYRLVYHDGIFEGLDNRKKVNLLNLAGKLCEEKRIQYILTVIDSDLPRNEVDQKLLFSQDEIIRELHDKGDSGRLFKMPAF